MTTHPPEPIKGETPAPLLTNIRIDDLFGRYTYVIDVPKDTDGRLLLLHGDNGSGKTTLLRLLWNLLSPANNRGHRTILARTPFRKLSIDFANGTHIVVNKKSELIGSYAITIQQPSKSEIVCNFLVDDAMRVPKPPTWAGRDLDLILTLDEDPGTQQAMDEWRSRLDEHATQQPYFEFLASQSVNPLLLADDRSLYSDDPELERIRERLTGLGEFPRSRSTSPRSGDIVARELQITLRRVNDRLRTLTLGGQNTGSAGANTIYKNMLRQLAVPGVPSSDLDESPTTSDRGTVGDLLRDLAKSSPRFEEFGLVPHFAASEFMDMLDNIRDDERRRLAQDILAPYLDSLRARQVALEEAEQLLRSLISIVNAFLVDKQVTFTPRDGLTIVTDDGIALDPVSLSSGERQLTMLLCTTILASQDSRLFIIDEPELSLGVAWQREILDALLGLTRGTALQFVVATHSVEIISGQPDSLVKLVRQTDEQRYT